MQDTIVPLEMEDYEVRAMEHWKRQRMSPELTAAFERLAPRAQFVVFARICLGWRRKWIAQRLEIGEPTISRTFLAAMDDLRQMIQREMPDHAHRT